MDQYQRVTVWHVSTSDAYFTRREDAEDYAKWFELTGFVEQDCLYRGDDGQLYRLEPVWVDVDKYLKYLEK